VPRPQDQQEQYQYQEQDDDYTYDSDYYQLTTPPIQPPTPPIQPPTLTIQQQEKEQDQEQDQDNENSDSDSDSDSETIYQDESDTMVAPMSDLIAKLYDQLQNGFHGCSLEEHEEQLDQHEHCQESSQLE
jgi:hypothetical protein